MILSDEIEGLIRILDAKIARISFINRAKVIINISIFNKLIIKYNLCGYLS